MFDNVKAFLKAPKLPDEMGDEEFRAVVREASVFFAAGWYRRKHPHASDAETLDFAQQNRKHFTDGAIDFVIFVSETRARRGQVPGN